MHKVIEFRGPQSEPVSEPLAPPRPWSRFWRWLKSLARTLNCIKTMCATEPMGPIRDRLETERANLVIGLFVARVAAMRLSSGEEAAEVAANSARADRPPRLTRFTRSQRYSPGWRRSQASNLPKSADIAVSDCESTVWLPSSSMVMV